MAQHNIVGGEGENLACRYLMERGFHILETNWRAGHLEIDIIARRGDTMHIVEVKTRTARVGDDFSPQKALTPIKLQRLLQAAEQYVVQHELRCQLSLDLAAVTMFEGQGSVEYFENVLY